MRREQIEFSGELPPPTDDDPIMRMNKWLSTAEASIAKLRSGIIPALGKPFGLLLFLVLCGGMGGSAFAFLPDPLEAGIIAGSTGFVCGLGMWLLARRLGRRTTLRRGKEIAEQLAESIARTVKLLNEFAVAEFVKQVTKLRERHTRKHRQTDEYYQPLLEEQKQQFDTEMHRIESEFAAASEGVRRKRASDTHAAEDRLRTGKEEIESRLGAGTASGRRRLCRENGRGDQDPEYRLGRDGERVERHDQCGCGDVQRTAHCWRPRLPAMGEVDARAAPGRSRHRRNSLRRTERRPARAHRCRAGGRTARPAARLERRGPGVPAIPGSLLGAAALPRRWPRRRRLRAAGDDAPLSHRAAPGKVRFTIIDPVGLGENFAAFMHLADHDEKLVTSQIWTEPPQIEQRLIDLTDHIASVIQKYLRNQYKSIEEYNRAAGEVAEPYRVLVIANFPTNFTPEAAKRLISIANSGPSCGVCTLVSVDTRAAMPRNFNIADLEAVSFTLAWKQDGFPGT